MGPDGAFGTYTNGYIGYEYTFDKGFGVKTLTDYRTRKLNWLDRVPKLDTHQNIRSF